MTHNTLTFPADVPGVLRMGSVVRFCDRSTWVVLRARPEAHDALIASPMTGAYKWAHLDDLALDLTDATSRYHTALWLAAQHLYEVATSADAPDLPEGVTWHVYMEEDTGYRYFVLMSEQGTFYFDDHEALEEVDHADATLLPDGSSRVDAEILCRLALHVTGRTP